jgi:hypothetical protein
METPPGESSTPSLTSFPVRFLRLLNVYLSFVWYVYYTIAEQGFACIAISYDYLVTCYIARAQLLVQDKVHTSREIMKSHQLSL